MADIHRAGDLEIDQDASFQWRMWTVQRVGWGVMALIVLVLIIAETTQQGLLGNDYSVTNTFLLVTTLLGLELGLGLLKEYFPRLGRWTDGLPLVIVEDGRLLEHRMKKVRIDESDILSAARERQGLERLDQIKYAVLEQHGGISIIPK